MKNPERAISENENGPPESIHGSLHTPDPCQPEITSLQQSAVSDLEDLFEGPDESANEPDTDNNTTGIMQVSFSEEPEKLPPPQNAGAESQSAEVMKISRQDVRQKNEVLKLSGLVRSEEARKKLEEQRKLALAHAESAQKRMREWSIIDELAGDERKRLEKERLAQIHALYRDNYFRYLHEAEKFRKDNGGKNIQCDICGGWDTDLIQLSDHTYCGKCQPPVSARAPERDIRAGVYRSSVDFRKT